MKFPSERPFLVFAFAKRTNIFLCLFSRNALVYIIVYLLPLSIVFLFQCCSFFSDFVCSLFFFGNHSSNECDEINGKRQTRQRFFSLSISLGKEQMMKSYEKMQFHSTRTMCFFLIEWETDGFTLLNQQQAITINVIAFFNCFNEQQSSCFVSLKKIDFDVEPNWTQSKWKV